MRKCFLFLLVLVLAVVVADARFDWQTQRKSAVIYRIDLSGSSPTQTELQNNFAAPGDFVLDTSNDTVYRVLNVTGPVLETIDVTGAKTFPAGLTVDAGGLTVTAGGVGITAGGLTVTAGGVLVSSGGLTLSTNDITMENGETLDNATDAELRLTANDDAALLVEFALESDNAVANLSDNDYGKFSFTAYDSATNKQEYASIDLVATDVTTATEDSQVEFNFLSGGVAKVVTLGSTSAGVMTLTLPTDMELVVDGKYVMTGQDATTALMTELVSGTTSANGSVTQAFTVAFGAAPTFVFEHTADPGLASTNWVGTTTTTNVIVNGAESMAWKAIAVGQRP